MNRVTIGNEEERFSTTLEKLVEDYSQDETAFIGKCGDGPDRALYLMCFDVIVEAENPQNVWPDTDCPVKVYRFVDVDITVRDRV